jgi:hypothetical protein
MQRGCIVDAKMLKELFNVGVVSKFQVVPVAMSSGWHLVACVRGEDRVLETFRGRARVFASLDTLVGQVQQITGRLPTALDLRF